MVSVRARKRRDSGLAARVELGRRVVVGTAARGRRVPPHMVQWVMGHERSSTTLDRYTRPTGNSSRILDALNDPVREGPNEDDPHDGSEPMSALA
jgi:hypothetical protein